MVNFRKLRDIQYDLQKPFINLLPKQRSLQIVRLASNLLSLCFVIAIMVLQNYPTMVYLARINTGHLDVALGLYKSLRSSLTESTMKSLTNDFLPVDSGLSDSEINILTSYAQSQVSNAPQYFILGGSEWCSVDYTTDFYDMSTSRSNMTTTCHDYTSFTLYNYRELLSSNSLEIILAYAYENTNAQTAAYTDWVNARTRRYRALRKVYSVQVALQAVLLLAVMVVYGNRGTARDLSRIPRLTLNLVATLALITGFLMIAPTAVMTNDLLSMKREIRNGLSAYGISMTIGRIYFCLLWLSLAFSSLSMLSWIIPLWCANPPEEEYEEELHSVVRKSNTSKSLEHYSVKPYQLRRSSRTATSSSRLFDQSDEIENPFTEESVENSSISGDSTIDSDVPNSYPQQVRSEHELRKLGEKLSRKPSVRRIHNASRSTQKLTLAPRSETHELLYTANPFSNHQYPQAFAKPMTEESLSRAASLTFNTIPHSSSRTRILLHESQNSFKPPQGPPDSENDTVDEASVLDDDEVAYLENNQFIN